MTPLKIAITKGRLLESSIELFELAGIECQALKTPGRRLILPIDNGRMEAVLAKAADVITYAEHGVCDLGIVGKDTIMEHSAQLYEIMDLEIGVCRLAVAGKPDTGFFSGIERRRAATKFINIAKNYFEKRCIDVELVKIEGSVELAPLLGLADVIVDIVETGSTLKANGLVVLEEICPVSARLVVNTAAMKLRKGEIDKLAEKLEKAVREKNR